MPSGWYNKGVDDVVRGTTVLTNPATIKCALLDSSYAFDRDHAFMSQVASFELSVAGYARQLLANAAITLDATADASYLDADNPTFGPLAAGETIGFMVIFRDTGDDATSPLLMCWGLVPVPTDGTEFEFPVSASGLSKFWSAT